MTPASLRDRIIDALTRDPMSTRQLADHLGAGYWAVRSHVDAMRDDGRVRFSGMHQGPAGAPSKMWEMV